MLIVLRWECLGIIIYNLEFLSSACGQSMCQHNLEEDVLVLSSPYLYPSLLVTLSCSALP